ncbi:MAG TPA: hypothetical protein VE092_01285 [Herbaspirillum sp.]|uniref:LpxL/LpxP family acyltransferase n=1 Tax=Herbaspirillum sp. TaxID=1890675 RepID=UPI002D23C0BA|nr:hypothetical protein [Herbaspirillum sp.]HZG18620.1 hypothetical protein [Herbaspirillum sp.]
MKRESMFDKLRRQKDKPAQIELLRELWDINSPMVLKANDNYQNTCRRLGIEAIESKLFIAGYLDSCYENAILAAEAAEITPHTVLDGGDRCLYICWHFRDYPAIRKELFKIKPLILIAQDADWLVELTNAGFTFNFRTAKNFLRLIRSMKSGRPLVAMFDYCYEETRHISIDFLSYNARTPVGILHLAKRYGYRIQILGTQSGEIGTLKRISCIEDVEVIAKEINKFLTAEIMAAPTHWIMWPALDQRI